MASNECFHFTKLKNLYSIKNIGLQPSLDENSKAVGDEKPKISFSDGKIGAIGLYLEFYRVFNDYKNGTRIPNKPGELEMYKKIMNSKSLEDYLGDGVYLLFDGTELENEGGNTGKGGIYDASTRTPIESNKLKIGLIRNNDTKKVSYSMYDYINYLMSTLSKEEALKMPTKFQQTMITYFNEHKEEIKKFRTGNYSQKDVNLDTFCRICKNDIDKDIEKNNKNVIVQNDREENEGR